jgi:hypothetical protein
MVFIEPPFRGVAAHELGGLQGILLTQRQAIPVTAGCGIRYFSAATVMPRCWK